MAKRTREEMDQMREMHLRKQEKRHRNALANRLSIQVLANGGESAPASIYILTNHSSLLINCGEGVQRLCHQLRAKLNRLEDIIITDGRWQNFGGLPGLLLTASAAGSSGITVHAPLALKEIFDTTKSFINLRGMDLKFDDSTFKTSTASGLKMMTVPLFSDRCKSYDILQPDQNRKSPASHDRLFTYAYIFHTAEIPGKLSAELCLSMGVKPGPMLGQLKAGQDVTLPDGRVVRASDVLSNAAPSRCFMVVDVPDTTFLPSLTTLLSSDERVREFITTNPDFVIHLTPHHVLSSTTYSHWLSNELPATTRHLVLNSDTRAESGVSQLASTGKVSQELGVLDTDLFPGLFSARVQEEEKEEGDSTRQTGVTGGSDGLKQFGDNLFYMPLSGSSIFMLSDISFSDEQRQSLLSSDLPRVGSSLEELVEPLSQYRAQCATIASNHQPDDIYPQMVFLGTGSSIPNFKRNVSCNLVRISEDQCIILDCGEGSLRQLIGLYGIDKTHEILSQLSVIFVSHMHADHHLGLVSLLEKRREVLGSAFRPCLLIAPDILTGYLRTYHQHISPLLDTFDFVDNASLLSHRIGTTTSVPDDLQHRLHNAGVDSVLTCVVNHCDKAYGVRVNLRARGSLPSRSLVFSGDTRPCQALIDLGRECDVLIHEATFQHELISEALQTLHSTCTEAIGVAKSMRARHVILTHFSQRYATVPKLPENLPDNVGVAFDNMKVSYNQLERLPLLIPLLKQFYAEDLLEMDDNMDRRLKKHELLSFVSGVGSHRPR